VTKKWFYTGHAPQLRLIVHILCTYLNNNFVFFLCFVSQEITDMERDKEAYWLVQLSQTFDFAPETFVLAISIMDRVSSLVKVGTY